MCRTSWPVADGTHWPVAPKGKRKIRPVSKKNPDRLQVCGGRGGYPLSAYPPSRATDALSPALFLLQLYFQTVRRCAMLHRRHSVRRGDATRLHGQVRHRNVLCRDGSHLARRSLVFIRYVGNGAFSQFVSLSGGQARIIDQWHNFLSSAIGVSPMVSSTIR